jgi:hypothetical protein
MSWKTMTFSSDSHSGKYSIHLISSRNTLLGKRYMHNKQIYIFQFVLVQILQCNGSGRGSSKGMRVYKGVCSIVLSLLARHAPTLFDSMSGCVPNFSS